MSDQAIDVMALRESLGWTQDRMAYYLGCHRSAVSRMESGQEQSGPIKRLLSALKAAKENGTVALVAPDPSSDASEAMAS